MNDGNLIPNSKRTPEQLRAQTSRGGINSGKARRRRKNMREIFQMVKDLPVRDGKLKAQLAAVGITDADTTYAAAMVWSTIYHAMRGNSQMMRLAYEMMGEDPALMLKEREIRLREKEAGQLGDTKPTVIILPDKDK